ncbi:oligosaccharide flippase family protein [Colwellia asteriadis]|uniref:Oligosaccharide flippase family protein n=1 Tax=Colwellia asteriadis TaxID=517723 RepID=A0ABN1L673_9GAMM
MNLLKGSAVALALRVLSALISFVVAASITRNLGTEQAGLYFYATSLIVLVVSVCSLGLNNTVLKHVAIYDSQKDNNKLNAVVNKSVLWSISFSLLVITILALLSLLLPFSKQPLTYQYYFLLTIPSLAIIALISHAIQAKGNIAVSMIMAGLIQPLSFLLINFYREPKDITTLAECYLISVTIALIFSAVFWLRRSQFIFTINFDSKVLLASCSSLLIFQVFQQFNTVIGQLFLGVWGSNTEVALFAVSIKVATLTSFIMFAVNRVVAPKFASLYAKNDMEGLQKAVTQSKRIMLAATSPLICILLIFPEFVLSLFGSEYKESAPVLRVLALIQFFSVWVGSVSYLLIMTGEEKTHRNNVIIASILSSVLGCIIVPYYPLWGAVIISGLCVILTCYLSSRAVTNKLNIKIFSLF